MFDEYLEPTRVERTVSPAPAVSVTSAGTPSSTTIDQDAPSPSHSLSSLTLRSPSLHQGITESTHMEDNPFPSSDNDPFVNMFAPEPGSEASSSGVLVHEDLGKLQPIVDIGIFVGYAPSRKGTGPAPTFLMPGQITVSISVTSAGTPSSTTIDQDAPYLSHSSSSSALQSPSLHQGVAAESTLIKKNPFAPVDNDRFINVFAPDLVLKHHHLGILVQQNLLMSLKHFNISGNKGKIAR
ncbi:hypothetical protein Tco_0026238 [Tanacetum coccineum]